MQGLFKILIIGHFFISTGCGHPTDVADEVLSPTPTDVDLPTDSESDMPTDSDSDTQTDPDTAPTAACEGFSAVPGDIERTIQVGGMTRSYILHIPTAYTGEAPVPLVVDFHAVQGSGENQLATSPYPAVTDPEGVITAFPNGLSGAAGTAWNFEICCVDGVDDLAFSRAMVADIGSVACIDRSRIYAVGKATGGGMAYYLACHAADLFAAAAPSSFDLPDELVDDCIPERPITIVSFRVSDNVLIPYDGAYSTAVPGHPVTFIGAVPTLEKWAALNGCTGAASDMGNGCVSYGVDQCNDGVEVWLCTAPGTESQNGNATIAWPILKAHTLP